MRALDKKIKIIKFDFGLTFKLDFRHFKLLI